MAALKSKIADLDETSEVVVLCSNIYIGDKHVLKDRLYSYDNTWSWSQVSGDLASATLEKDRGLKKQNRYCHHIATK